MASNDWIYEFSVLLHKLNSQTTPWPLEVKINIISLKSITQSSKSIDVLWMLGPDENLIKCTLLVQRSPQALIDYHTMLFSPQFSSFIRQSIQERYIYIYRERGREGVDMIMKVQGITKNIFLKGNKISLVFIKLFVV